MTCQTRFSIILNHPLLSMPKLLEPYHLKDILDVTIKLALNITEKADLRPPLP